MEVICVLWGEGDSNRIDMHKIESKFSLGLSLFLGIIRVCCVSFWNLFCASSFYTFESYLCIYL